MVFLAIQRPFAEIPKILQSNPAQGQSRPAGFRSRTATPWMRRDSSAWHLPSDAYGVPLGINRANVRSPPISVKIWFRLEVGREAATQVPLLPVAL